MLIKVKTKPTVVPCGRCIGCRLARSRDWANRCENERQMHRDSCFITLTYSDENLTLGNYRPTLVPRDLQLFWKRLRKETDVSFRYFACGEYGESTYRPHYHACIYGYDFQDKKYKTTKNGNDLFTSDTLDRIWGFGNCIVGCATWESAAYVARYIIGKKLGADAVMYEREGIEPEFTRMSRRPAIGLSWLHRFSGDVFNSGYMVSRGVKMKPPRYYLNKFKENEPQIMEARKMEQLAIIESRPNLNSRKKAELRGVIKKAQIRTLTRDL